MFHVDHPRTEVDGKEQINYIENRNLAEEIQTMNHLSLERYIQKLKKENLGNSEKYINSKNLIPMK